MSGKCKCGSITYTVPHLPHEIADCYCSICQRLHNKTFMSFAKYDINKIIFTGRENLLMIPTSDHASRGYCNLCDSPLFMHYDQSQNIWIVIDSLSDNCESIEHYDIHRQKTT